MTEREEIGEALRRAAQAEYERECAASRDRPMRRGPSRWPVVAVIGTLLLGAAAGAVVLVGGPAWRNEQNWEAALSGKALPYPDGCWIIESGGAWHQSNVEPKSMADGTIRFVDLDGLEVTLTPPFRVTRRR